MRGPTIAEVIVGWRKDECDRELNQRDAGFIGDRRELLDGLEFALVAGLGEVEALGEPAGP